MELAYAAADVIVSRAGAMTCCEILAAGKPSILVLTCILTCLLTCVYLFHKYYNKLGSVVVFSCL